MYRHKPKQEILSQEFITRTDIQMLFKIGAPKAQVIFDKVQQAVIDDGKINIPGKVSVHRLYRMMGLPLSKYATS